MRFLPSMPVCTVRCMMQDRLYILSYGS